MDETKLSEILSELLIMEIDEVEQSSVIYENDRAKEIIVRMEEKSFKITVREN